MVNFDCSDMNVDVMRQIIEFDYFECFGCVRIMVWLKRNGLSSFLKFVV